MIPLAGQTIDQLFCSQSSPKYTKRYFVNYSKNLLKSLNLASSAALEKTIQLKIRVDINILTKMFW